MIITLDFIMEWLELFCNFGNMIVDILSYSTVDLLMDINPILAIGLITIFPNPVIEMPISAIVFTTGVGIYVGLTVYKWLLGAIPGLGGGS